FSHQHRVRISTMHGRLSLLSYCGAKNIGTLLTTNNHSFKYRNMHISKSLATDVAKKLLEKRKEQYQSAEQKLIIMADELALESLTSELKIAFEKFKEYFRTESNVTFISYINDTREELYSTLSINIPC